jgi:DNA replication ATP-dependent helicase Dna2
LVREYLTQTACSLFLGAYTNRAVDEICDKLVQLGIPFLRVGNHHGAEQRFHPYLLQEKIQEAGTREGILTLLREVRVVVGTIAALHTRPELLALKDFDIAIIDEASQVLEPQLLPLLAKVRKFILIGDPKQLPAVVLQPVEATHTHDPALLEIGLRNLRNSYFERLLEQIRMEGWTWATTVLRNQGRMHRELLAFPNQEYYDGLLDLAEEKALNDRQRAPFAAAEWFRNQPEFAHLARRLVFCDSTPLLQSAVDTDPDATPIATSMKAHPEEARQIVRHAEALYDFYVHTIGQDQTEADFRKLVGVITPFRDQIALIRRRLLARATQANKPGLATLTVDTVERYQGSQREHILVSLCLNVSWQLDTLCAVTDVAPLIGSAPPKPTDRKLNVLLTRAREQLVIFGNARLMQLSPGYARLLAHIAQTTAPEPS